MKIRLIQFNNCVSYINKKIENYRKKNDLILYTYRLFNQLYIIIFTIYLRTFRFTFQNIQFSIPFETARDHRIKVLVNDCGTGWVNISIYPLPKDIVSAYGCRLRYIKRRMEVNYIRLNCCSTYGRTRCNGEKVFQPRIWLTAILIKKKKNYSDKQFSKPPSSFGKLIRFYIFG